jgi:hypothetical protein
MSNQNYTPGLGNLPFGNTPLNPEGSNYAANSGYTTAETILIEKAVREAIFDAAPEQYKALRLVFEKNFIEYNNDEFEYLEKTFGRSALECNAIVAAVAAVPGAAVQQVIAFQAASIPHVGIDLILVYPDGTKGIVKSIAGNNITVESQTSVGLPATAVGDIFAIQSTIIADGMNSFSNYERMQTITRYNYIQFFLRAARWARIERQKHINSGRTNYMELDQKEKMDQLRTDLFVSFFNGTRGEFALANGQPAKSMGGIFPTMQAAGSMFGTPTLAGLRSQFETLAFKTNYKKEGGVRMIYGTDEILYALSSIFKDPGTRYTPNDRIADMNLTEYKIGNMRFVPVTCELFKEPACFPKEWAKRLLVLDQETISPVKMKGIESMNSGASKIGMLRLTYRYNSTTH